LFRALREHLRRLETLDKERRDRLGYERAPATGFAVWDKGAAWPEEQSRSGLNGPGVISWAAHRR